MPAWLIAVGTKYLLPIFKWLGLNIIIPWATGLAKAFFKKREIKKEQAKKEEANAQRNQEYENNPSDDSFGNSP